MNRGITILRDEAGAPRALAYDAATRAGNGAGTVPERWATWVKGQPCACGCGAPVMRKRGALYAADSHKRRAFIPKDKRVPVQPSLFDPAPGIKVHLSEGQTLQSEQPRWGGDCARVIKGLLCDPARWWTMEALAFASGVREGSIRTRVSNIHKDPSRWGIELEKRTGPHGVVEVRIKG